MRRLPYPLLVLFVLAVGLVGCGGGDEESPTTGAETTESPTTGGETTTATGDTETFDEADFDVTFEYPSEFDPLDDISFNRSAGSSAVATAGVGLDATNLLALQRFDLNIEVTEDNIDEVRPEADMLFSQLAGEEVEGKDVEVGGLPALEYEIMLTEPADARTRATAIFDGSTQYLFNCQSTPAEQEAVEAACDTALETLEPK